jgi:hypothetical protein
MKIKTKTLFSIIASVLIISMLTPVIAQTGFLLPSRAEFDPVYAGTKMEAAYSKMTITTQQEAEKYPFTWWRDTTAQNRLWTHSAENYPNQVIVAYADADTRVLVYAGQIGTNVVAIVGPTGNTIIGCGGSRNAAKLALTRSQMLCQISNLIYGV